MTATTASRTTRPRSAAARKAAGATDAETEMIAAPTAEDVEVELPTPAPETADIMTAEIEVEHDEETAPGAPPPLVQGGKVRVRLRHKRGCPKDPHRIEKIPARIPPNRDQGLPAVDVIVVRCVDCGESDVAGDRRYEDDEL